MTGEYEEGGAPDWRYDYGRAEAQAIVTMSTRLLVTYRNKRSICTPKTGRGRRDL